MTESSLSRRDFIRTTAVAGAALTTAAPRVFAAGSDAVRVAMVG